jgi:hypothetical protein
MKDRETDGMTDDEIDRTLASLPYPRPRTDFADRVMARVAVPTALEVRRPARVAARRPLAVATAAATAVAVVGPLAASVIWALTHWTLAMSLGGWLAAMAGQWTLGGLQALVQAVVMQPGSVLLRALSVPPATLAAVSALGSLVYLSGVLALRRLLTAPTRQVMHARG